MPHWLMSFGVICLFLGFGWAFQLLWHRSEIGRLNVRNSLGINDLYARYYATSGLSEESVAEVWREIAMTLKVPPEKLRPSDKFGEDIGTFVHMNVELDNLSDKAAERARQLGIDVQLGKIATIDDYVRTLARRE
jgi:hypothetical protein